MALQSAKAVALTAIAQVASLAITGVATAQLKAEAIPGVPFGVGSVTVPIGAMTGPVDFAIEDAEGRVLYPAFSNGRVGRLVGELLGVNGRAGDSVTATFLFTGDRPLRVTVYSPEPRTVELVPRVQRRRGYDRLLTTWWRDYNAAARNESRQGDYPSTVNTYLTAMLGNRLGLRPPLLTRIGQSGESSELQKTLDLLMGAESVRDALIRETMSGQRVREEASFAVPDDVLWQPLVMPTLDEVDIEPMAMRVPEECFYVRFGTFRNYLWLNDLLSEHGGDISRMATARGHDAGVNSRIERQLALTRSPLAKMFGPTVIEDVAIIGRDIYLAEGAAIGILFKAKSSTALGADIGQQRAAALAKAKDLGATNERVTIAGRDVSFLSTPDNQLRSFYIADGDFHLVTTSREIVRRFCEVAEGDRALGASAEFRHARQRMRLVREDTVFAYFSSAFFRGLVSPQYQIERRRRLQAVTDIELIQLARLAARNEGHDAETIDELTAARVLPAGFGRNADGSGPIIERDRVIDSLRGARGSFLPIPDVELRGVSRDEGARYLQRAAYYQQNWRQMDPLMVGVQRFAVEGVEGRERLVIDANVSPIAEDKYGWLLSMVGPPSSEQIITPPDELISLQATLKGGLLFPSVQPHHLFMGVRDLAPNVDPTPTGFLQVLRLMQETPGYLGAWPKLGLLDLLPLDLGRGPDVFGFSRLLFGVWRWQGDGFSVLSFNRAVLEETVPQLGVAPSDNPAQIRLHVGDLSDSQLASWLTRLNYERARQVSIGNTRLMHNLSQQLGVPREEARTTAEQLLDTKLMCALGGEYELDRSSGLPTWTSTAWHGAPPPDYAAPILQWFRGLDLNLTKTGDRLTMHSVIDMQRAKTSEPAPKLPFFNLFGGSEREEIDKPADPDDPFDE